MDVEILLIKPDKDGAKIKIKGRGAPGAAGPGDLYVLIHVTPHPIFSILIIT